MFARLSIFLILAVLSFLPSLTVAAVKPNALFSDDAVLQRDREIPVWGSANDGERVTVELNGQKVSTVAKDGRWLVKLPAMTAGGPFIMTISGENTLTVKNILIGEVWLCSGQSNMERQLGPRPPQLPIVNWEQDAAAADYPQIRQIQIPSKISDKPQADFTGQWKICTPENVKNFSAVGFYFARDLQKEIKVPIGLIFSAWGGTKIEPWLSRQAIEGNPGMEPEQDWLKKADAAYEKGKQDYLQAVEKWLPLARQAVQSNVSLPEPLVAPAHLIAANNQNSTAIFNGMINPLAPFAIRGAIWYQGESNVGNPDHYADQLKALITGWRQLWQQGDFPFYVVQIAPYYGYGANDKLARLWMSEIKAVQSVANSGIASTMDIGNFKDIHPQYKAPVGERLARLALAQVYGQKDLACLSPQYAGQTIDGSKISVEFKTTGMGLVSKDGEPLNCFEIAGRDKNYVPAEAVIEGGKVVVSAAAVNKPAFVRYGWMVKQDNKTPNLVSKDGLPALPFQTE
jgi:sialate O-acetylesterase